METTSLLQQIRDNWLLVFLFTLFIVVVLWAFRPGSRETHRDAASLPFRNEDRPAPDRPDDASSDEKDRS
ncbi:MAG: cbb3-type cytochrome c oxidase subunit 3 [Rubellimicrobium sp.]|nr:cbb3-type cytochrome c oxidase subunit 3 [Rubellimicrobium sp.]